MASTGGGAAPSRGPVAKPDTLTPTCARAEGDESKKENKKLKARKKASKNEEQNRKCTCERKAGARPSDKKRSITEKPPDKI